MKNIKRALLSLILILVSFFVFNDRVDALPQLQCEYEGILGTYCSSNDELCKIKVTIKLEQNKMSAPTFTWVNGFDSSLEGCGAGGNVSTCFDKNVVNGLKYNINSNVNFIKLNNGKYEITDDSNNYINYLLNSDKTYYQCPERINILREKKLEDEDNVHTSFSLSVFISDGEFNESYCENNAIGSFGCDSSNNQRDTLKLSRKVYAMPYTGGEVEHNPGNCCVYTDSKSNVPVYIYSYDKGTKKEYASCVGLNCMTLSPLANHILGSEWSDYHHLDDCSKMPSKIWFTFKGFKNERTLAGSCHAPTKEPSNVYKAYEDAVFHQTAQAAQDLIDKENEKENGSGSGSNTIDNYTCNYRSQKYSGNTIKVKYRSESVSNEVNFNITLLSYWDISYPDRADETFIGSLTKGSKFPTSKCEDIFYSRKTGKIFAVDEDSYYHEQTINQYCSLYDDLEQFCQDGKCKITNVACGNSALETEWGTCPYILLPIVKFIKIVVFNTLQIFVPIILILMGTIELVKAVASSDDKAISGATGKLIKKILTAILIFFITTIVNIVMNALAKADIDGFEDWKACWFYNEIDDDKTDK